MHIVRVGAVEGFERLVMESGHNPVEIIRSSGLRSAQFRDPDSFISYVCLAKLMEKAALCCRQPLFGLLLAQRQNLLVLGDLPVMAAQARTVGEALARVNDFLYLNSSGLTLILKPLGEWLRLSFEIEIDHQCCTSQLMQLSVGQLAKFVSGLLNKDFSCMTLYLSQPGCSQWFDDVRGDLPWIRFGQQFNGLLLRANVLNKKNHQDVVALDRHFQQHLNELRRRYPNNLCQQTMNIISHLLPSGECRLERVARALDLHPRTLQKQLKVRSSSYRQLLQQVRENTAKRLMYENRHSITDIALQIGYAETAVFSRHFRNWTGSSPSQWVALAIRSDQQ